MIFTLKKSFLLLFTVLLCQTVEAQNKYFRVSVLDMKFTFDNVHTNYDTLLFHYKDQASKPHYFWDTIQPPATSTLLGGDISIACMSVPKSFYFDGLTIGARGRHQQIMLSVYSGCGYEHTFWNHLRVIPHMLVGWSSLDYYYGYFIPSNGINYVVSGTELDGQSTLRIHTSSFWVAPRLSLNCEFWDFFDVSLSAGYRMMCGSHEKMEFSDHYKNYAYIPLNQCLEYHGAYLNKHVYDISGLMFNIGVIFYID